jgi:hypothetical protein
LKRKKEEKDKMIPLKGGFPRKVKSFAFWEIPPLGGGILPSFFPSPPKGGDLPKSFILSLFWEIPLLRGLPLKNFLLNIKYALFKVTIFFLKKKNERKDPPKGGDFLSSEKRIKRRKDPPPKGGGISQKANDPLLGGWEKRRKDPPPKGGSPKKRSFSLFPFYPSLHFILLLIRF